MKEQLERIKKEFVGALEEVKDALMLEELEQRFFSRKSGELTQAMKGLKDVSVEMKKELGQFANVVKQELSGMLDNKKEELENKSFEDLAKNEAIDVTQSPLPKKKKGAIHPMSIIHRELEELFRSMGFMVLDGPELESDYFNFEALNIPKDHPARDGHDTFFIKDHSDWVMRTQTSPVQVRGMLKYGAPLRAVVPGRVFRNEATDGSHDHTFFQMEGLIVDKGLSISHLIGVMKGLLEGILKKDVTIRLRPGFFPFVEPGFELDMVCLICNGKGCKACGNTGWVEIIPCGLVHPEVIKAGGLDPEEYTGFAFGLGSMRLVMQRYGIEDIRHFMKGDLRFLDQF
ncbi:phenylalanine--tRNA ligase subunit alpha [Patescibacteria group bacterium]|nr:phenylalanine--tRNA ligase subunit alpha [Patescibacteria group bacterium]MBU1721509.1 phenylalanine--tRNA ligase subunit alpha [Patescibacteria group bacterium]MBU1900919.1 phenylalanine--tRNA ligase subunit alpha [Patescibacteria group bacterium]